MGHEGTPDAVPDDEDGSPTTGEGADSAFEAMLRKRLEQGLPPAEPLPSHEAPKPDGKTGA